MHIRSGGGRHHDDRRRPAPPTDAVQLPAEKFRAAMQSAGIGAGHDVPHLSEELIAKYIADLRQLGLLDDAR